MTAMPRTEKNGDANAGECRQVHFHVTYWMFYPFSEGKTICVLDLGFFGSWPIPTVAGVCVGMLKEYGSHIGDWEHMSLYFKVKYAFGDRSLGCFPSFPRVLLVADDFSFSLSSQHLNF